MEVRPALRTLPRAPSCLQENGIVKKNRTRASPQQAGGRKQTKEDMKEGSTDAIRRERKIPARVQEAFSSKKIATLSRTRGMEAV